MEDQSSFLDPPRQRLTDLSVYALAKQWANRLYCSSVLVMYAGAPLRSSCRKLRVFTGRVSWGNTVCIYEHLPLLVTIRRTPTEPVVRGGPVDILSSISASFSPRILYARTHARTLASRTTGGEHCATQKHRHRSRITASTAKQLYNHERAGQKCYHRCRNGITHVADLVQVYMRALLTLHHNNVIYRFLVQYISFLFIR